MILAIAAHGNVDAEKNLWPPSSTCVKLAGDVMNVAPREKLKAMIEVAKDDALPEVRFAG